jgi:hypothetical protein
MLGSIPQGNFTVPAVADSGEAEGVRESHIFCVNHRREYVIKWTLAGEIVDQQVVKGVGA